MTDAAAFKATFADWRTVKSRKVLQLFMEVPLEQQGQILTILGAPDPVNPAWVGIALLAKESAQGASAPVLPTQSSPVNTKEKREWADLPLATRAGIRCGEVSFWRFLEEKMGFVKGRISDAETAADFLRRHCRVESRADLGKDRVAAVMFHNLMGEYDAWMRT